MLKIVLSPSQVLYFVLFLLLLATLSGLYGVVFLDTEYGDAPFDIFFAN